METNNADLKKLIKWMKNPNNSAAKLAVDLGYKSTNSVYQWICRGKLPRKNRAEILKRISK